MPPPQSALAVSPWTAKSSVAAWRETPLPRWDAALLRYNAKGTLDSLGDQHRHGHPGISARAAITPMRLRFKRRENRGSGTFANLPQHSTRRAPLQHDARSTRPGSAVRMVRHDQRPRFRQGYAGRCADGHKIVAREMPTPVWRPACLAEVQRTAARLGFEPPGRDPRRRASIITRFRRRPERRRCHSRGRVR